LNKVAIPKEDADNLYLALSESGSDKAPMWEEFWGYWGCCLDKFGIRWMLNVMKDQNNK